MRKPLLVMPAVLALALTACTPTEVTSSPDDTPAGPVEKKTQKAEARIGDTITLKGNEDGLKLEVTVVKALSSAKPKDEFFVPEPGQRFAAVQIRLKNVGSTTYDDSPANGATLVDAQDQQYDETMGQIAQGPSIGSSVKLAPGGTRKGYLVFSIPKKAKIARFQFALDSGFGPQTGEWLLK